MGNFNQGKAPAGILVRALTENVFQAQSLAYMNTGDKDGYNVFKHDIKNVLRARTDNPASSVTNTSKKQNYKRTLAVRETFETFNPSEYYEYWKEFQPKGEFQWEGLPANVQNSLADLFLATSVEAVQDELTNGSSDGEVVGLVEQLRNSSLVNLNGGDATPDQVVNNLAIAFRAHGAGAGDEAGVAITTANIFDKFELLKTKQTKGQRKRIHRKYMVNQTTADIFTSALRGQEFKGAEISQEGELRFAGIPIIINTSLDDSEIILASMSGNMKDDAIQMGTSNNSDFNNLTVAKLGEFNRIWGMALTFAIDIFVVRPEEICYYTTEALV